MKVSSVLPCVITGGASCSLFIANEWTQLLFRLVIIVYPPQSPSITSAFQMSPAGAFILSNLDLQHVGDDSLVFLLHRHPSLCSNGNCFNGLALHLRTYSVGKEVPEVSVSFNFPCYKETGLYMSSSVLNFSAFSNLLNELLVWTLGFWAAELRSGKVTVFICILLISIRI